MNKWNLIIDVALCENCNNCTLSAKDEYVGNDHPGYSAAAPLEGADLITIDRQVRGEAPVLDTAYLVKMCNHCDDAPCMKVGGDAVKKRADGIVIIDPVKAKGRRDILEACPYGAISWNTDKELPQNWIFDAHLLDQGWRHPRCQQACPTDVFEAVKISDEQMAKRAQAQGLRVLQAELGTRPRIYYKNLYRFTHCFIGGTVVAVVNGVENCVVNAEISLYRGGERVGATSSDEFGEFKLDQLEAGSGDYSIEINHPQLGRAECETSLGDSGDSIYLGVITLNAG